VAGGHRQLPGQPSGQAIGIEYDHYDIPKTLHLAYLDAPASSVPPNENATILGCLRLLPTDGNYMIRDNIDRGGWKDVELLVDHLPNQSDVYEASRIAVAPYLSKGDPLRDTIVENLVYANVELGVRLGIRKMVGIMYHHIWQAVYCKRGVPVRYISEPFQVDDGLPVIIGGSTRLQASWAT
jgi:N-acyl-L-homoserine lactone synthetase